MMEPIDLTSARHYSWGRVCDGWHLLDSQGLSVIQERIPPLAGETPHFHERAHQFFFVLSGIATMEFEDHAVRLEPGQGLHVPPDVPHRIVNASVADLDLLVVSAPTTKGDRHNAHTS